jgi:hypothetical protein
MQVIVPVHPSSFTPYRFGKEYACDLHKALLETAEDVDQGQWLNAWSESKFLKRHALKHLLESNSPSPVRTIESVGADPRWECKIFNDSTGLPEGMLCAWPVIRHKKYIS